MIRYLSNSLDQAAETAYEIIKVGLCHSMPHSSLSDLFSTDGNSKNVTQKFASAPLRSEVDRLVRGIYCGSRMERIRGSHETLLPHRCRNRRMYAAPRTNSG